jgi:hypothetical protein
MEEFEKNQIGRRNVLALKDLPNISDQSYSLLQRHRASQ